MGYELHITRAAHWFESEESPIALSEWLNYVETDPEMRLDTIAVGHVDGKPVITYENEGLAVWVAHSQPGDQGNMVWMDYRKGRVVVKNPDEETLAKMRSIAIVLNAKIFGDDGEEYEMQYDHT